MPKDTKIKLLDHAEHAARSHGYDGFSYADLAQAVGIRKASIHYYFPSKSDLSVALIETYTARMTATCERIDERCETGGQKLLELIDVYRHSLNGGETLCLCVAFSTSAESLPEAVMRRIVEFRDDISAWLGRMFAHGQHDGTISDVTSPAAEARATLALLEGAQLAARAAGDQAAFDAALVLVSERVRTRAGSG